MNLNFKNDMIPKRVEKLKSTFTARECVTPSNQSDEKYLERRPRMLPRKRPPKAVTKVSEHAGEKAGDKISELLLKKKAPAVQSTPSSPTTQSDQPLSDYDVYERVNQLYSGGKLRCVRFM